MLGAALPHHVGRQVVGVAAVEKQVSVDGVADGREPAGERHGAADVAPEAAVVVDPDAGIGDVGGDGEVGEPVVADVAVPPEQGLQDEVEVVAVEVGGVGMRQVEQPPPDLSHFVAKLAHFDGDFRQVAFARVQPADEGPDADAGHLVDGDAGLGDGADEADVGAAARAAAAQDQADALAGNGARQTRKVRMNGGRGTVDDGRVFRLLGEHPARRLDVVVSVDPPAVLEPVGRAHRVLRVLVVQKHHLLPRPARQVL